MRDLVYDIVYWAENLEIVDLSLQIAVKFLFMTSKVIETREMLFH